MHEAGTGTICDHVTQLRITAASTLRGAYCTSMLIAEVTSEEQGEAESTQSVPTSRATEQASALVHT